MHERRQLARIERGSTLEFRGHRIVVNDPPNVRVLCRDLFDNHVYNFQSEQPDPRILDCGSNIGMSVIYFKDLYPAAAIVALEPDPAIFPYLEENIRLNGLERIELVQAAVAGETGSADVLLRCEVRQPARWRRQRRTTEGWERFEVPVVQLDSLLAEPVDFMKMNIEGAETAALEAAGDALRNVRDVVSRYRHVPGLPRTLHRLLAVLDAHGFEYLVHDYYGERHGPFSLTADTRAFPLVHAARKD